MNNDITVIKVKKPYKSNSSASVFNVHSGNAPVLIQTPVCVIPYSYLLYDDNSLKVDVNFTETCFDPLLRSIEEKVQDMVKRFDATCLRDVSLSRLCEKETRDDQPAYKMSFRTRNIHRVGIFNCRNQPMDLSQVQTFDKVLCLFEVSRFVVKGSKTFWQTQLVQIKQLSPSSFITKQTPCLIIDYSGYDHEHPNSHDVYNKMLKLGIPLDGVVHKMKLDGMNDDVIAEFRLQHTTRLVQPAVQGHLRMPMPPPPPPPPPPKLLLDGASAHIQTRKEHVPQFLKDISSGNFALKTLSKQHDNCRREKLAIPKAQRFAVPTLSELLNIKARLKKIHRDSSSGSSNQNSTLTT